MSPLSKREINKIIVDEILATVPHLPENEISMDRGFLEMGIGSLEAVEIISNLSEIFKFPLDPTTLFDKPNLEALSDYVFEILNGNKELKLGNQESRENNQVQKSVSVIGMSCRFPNSLNIDQYFKLLKDGVNAIREQQRSGWENATPDYIRKFGALDAINEFAADVFGVSDHEASLIDPQQRILLEEVWSAIEDAGLSVSSLRGSNTGVYVGISGHDYSYSIQEKESSNVYSMTGNAHSIAANRISYLYDLKGPSIAVDTACSSSLVALDLACKALQSNQIDYAIVAGVNLILKPEISSAFAKATMLSPDGQCKTFSENANGYVRGEGVGVVVLKKINDVNDFNERVYAEILVTEINQDGRSSSLTAPNGSSQELLIKKAMTKANLNAEDIIFHEAHGTGTSLGDPIEALSLERIHQFRKESKPLLLSSVKTNIGHLEAAAGMAGLIKVILSLYHQVAFKSLNFTSLNPHLKNKIPHLKVVTENISLADEMNLIGSVSSFGFGGTNAHAILARKSGTLENKKDSMETLFNYAYIGISSNSKEGLAKTITELRKENNWENILKLSASLKSRLELKEQLYFYAKNEDDFKQVVDSILLDKFNQQCFFRKKTSRQEKVALIFTGQGSQYQGMFQALYDNDVVFQKRVDHVLLLAQKFFSINLYEVWRNPERDSDLKKTSYAQILIFALQVAFTQWLTEKWGMSFDVVFGHSLGELAAMVAAGVLTLEEGIYLVSVRGHFMQTTKAGLMTIVFERKEVINELIKKHDIKVELAANNGQDLQVYSGADAEIRQLCSLLKENKIRTQLLIIDKGFHSSLMDEILPPFKSSIKDLKYNSSNKLIVSSLSGALLPANFNFDENYWSDQLRNATQFEKAMRTIENLGCSVVLEIGPDPILNVMGQKIIENKKIEWINFIDSKKSNLDTIAISMLKLWHLGLINQGLVSGNNPNLPKTIMTKNIFWSEGNSMNTKKTVDLKTKQGEKVLLNLAKIIADITRVELEEVEVDSPLVDLGIDSLDLLNAVQVIKDTYQVSIPISEVFSDLNTIRKIAHYVSDQSERLAVERINIESASSAFESTAIIKSNFGLSDSSELVQLFQNQLTIISNQLRILRLDGGDSQDRTGLDEKSLSPLSRPGKSLEGLENEKRGVLGNFRSRASNDREEDKNSNRKEFLDETIKKLNEKTKKTKAHVQNHRKYLADNRVSAGFRPNTKEMIYPIHCDSAKGSKFIDLDGNEFIDFTMGFGVNLFGHSPEFLDKALSDQLKKGLCVGPQSSMAGPIAKLICEITGHERAAFLNSGTEAVMTAIRLARAYHKKNKLVIFDGSYHGHFDGVLAKGSKNLTSMPVAAGITQNMVNDVLVLEYGNFESLAIIRENIKDLAAVLVEPVQSRFPENQPVEFLRELRKITSENDIAFIWDEVITGFRIAPGGAQEHFGIKADLASYGKVLGGGMPIGAVAGQSRYLDFIDGGFWQFGDQSYPRNEMTFFAGTFCKHPLAMATTLATLEKIKTDGKKIIKGLNEKTKNLSLELNSVFEKLGIDVRVNNFGSLFRFKGSVNLDLLFTKLIEKGFYIWEGRNCFLSTEHSDSDLKSFIQAVENCSKELIDAQFYQCQRIENKLEKNLNSSGHELSPYQLRFLNLERMSSLSSNANNVCVSAKIKGHLDVAKLKQALEIISKKRDVFRTRTNITEGKQYFTEKIVPIDFEFESYRTIERPWRIIDKRLLEISKTKFNLESESPMKIKLFDVVDQTYLLAVVAHHILFDGWSMTLFFEDLASVYNSLLKNETPDLRFAVSFEDVIMNSKINEEIKTKLERKLESFDSGMKLIPLSDKDYDYSGERIVFDIELKTYESLKRWCKENRITPFMLLCTAFSKVLSKQFQKNNLAIAIPAANRDYKGSEVMYGCTANLVPLIIENKDDSVKEAVFSVKEKIVSGYQTMTYPYELLKKSTGPLFDVYFNLEPVSDLPKLDNATLLIYPFQINACEFPLMLNITDFEHYYHCELDFQTKYFNDSQILKMIEDIRKLLRNEFVK